MYHCGGCTCIYREDQGGGDEHGDGGAESDGESVQLRWVYAHWHTYAMVKVPCQQPTSFSMLNLKNVCALKSITRSTVNG